MEIFIAQTVNGLAIGSLYALAIVGINLLLLVRGVMHFSYPHIVVVAMYVFWMVLEATQINMFLAVPATIIAAIILTVLTEFLFRPLALRKAFLETVIVSLGIGIILTEIMSHYFNQGLPISFPTRDMGGGEIITWGMITFSMGHIYTLAGTIGAAIGLFFFLYRHKQGKAFRAIAQDLDVALLLGIPFNRTGVYSFAIAGFLAGVVAIFLALTLGSASAFLGDTLAIKAMVLILFAGMGNLLGGLICALLVGLAEALTMAYLPGRWSEAIVFGAIMMVIIIKPQGLFGSRT